MEDDSEWIRRRGDCSVFFGYAQNPRKHSAQIRKMTCITSRCFR